MNAAYNHGMCGRFTLRKPQGVLVEEFGLTAAPEMSPRYNVAPTQAIQAVRQTPAGDRELVEMRWGFAGTADGSNRLINARVETAATKPTFRDAFRSRRCLIPADGFLEWQRAGRRKQPYLIERRDHGLLAMAGLWQRWDEGGGPVESCTILTMPANELLRDLHDRMPVILPRSAYEAWLNPELSDPKRLQELIHPYPSEELTAVPVSPRVNSPENDDARCLEPATAQRTLFG